MLLTDPQRADLLAKIAYWDARAVFYEGESIKLRERHARRTEQVLDEASLAAIQRPSVIMDFGAVAYHWNGSDPKLNEYGAGMQIVERRATMYAQLAANARLALMLDRFAQGIDITGSFTR